MNVYSYDTHDGDESEYPVRVAVSVMDHSNVTAHVRAIVHLLRAATFSEKTICEGMAEYLVECGYGDG